ncbi:MAG: hypothetical protein KIT17_08085 [Rubrivivax sp.]|nr:hypothetical protein [Rubrivivax sp.]
MGPWIVIGPLAGTDGRFTRWRATRAALDAPGDEVALLVPWRWPARHDLPARLEQAARAVLRLSHSGVARLLAVGVAEEGTPWLATELAEGQSIERWCFDRALPTSARLALFGQVLEPVLRAQALRLVHGHVHPAEIVVSPADQGVRWLHFGLSEVLDAIEVPSPPESTAPAHAARAYAAPELAGGGPATPAGDMHALGAVLCELLAGRPPWAPRSGSAVAAATTEHLLLPSEAATTRALRRALRGDLDAIVARATHADASLRYGSAGELAEDLRRAASHRPVAARQGGIVYQLSCLVRRRPLRSGMVGTALVAGVTGLLSLASIGLAELLDHGRREAQALSRLDDSLPWLTQQLLLQGLPPVTAESAGAQWLQRGEAAARASLEGQPVRLGRALAYLGRLQAERGAFAEGHRLLAEAMRVLVDEWERAEVGCDQAWAQARQGGEVADVARDLQASAEAPSLPAKTRALCAARLADVEQRAGRWREAYLAGQRAWSLLDKPAAHAPQLALLVLHPMATRSVALGRHEEARVWLDRALQQAAALKLDRDPRMLELREQLAALHLAAGDAVRAMEIADENLALAVDHAVPNAGPGPSGTTDRAAALQYAAAEPRLALHRISEAQALLERSLGAGASREHTLRTRCLLATATLRAGDLPGAARWLKATSPAPIENGADAVCRLARAELALREGRSIETVSEVDRIGSHQGTAQQRAHAALLRAEALLAASQFERALGAANLALQQARALHPSDVEDRKARPSFRSGQAALVVAEAHRALGDIDAATRSLDHAMQQLGATLPEDHPWRRRAEALKVTLAAGNSKERP